MEHSTPSRKARAFTLLELLTSITILALIVTILFEVINHTTEIWRRNRNQVEAFQSSRFAFERITSQLAQATLDTYLDYYDSTGQQSRTDYQRDNSNTVSFEPKKYGWASDLQFVMGGAATLASNAGGSTPTHAVFFIAPTGRVSGATASKDYRNLDKLLNAIGYYIQFGSDQDEIPAFFQGKVKERYRYRLMEMNQPSEDLQVYLGNYSGNDAWYKQAIKSGTGSTPATFALADNVVALILRPLVSKAEEDTTVGNKIEGEYAFDSKEYKNSSNDGSKLRKNQLPPLVQVTMVTIDEASAARLANTNGTTAPSLVPSDAFSDPTNFKNDLDDLKKKLTDLHLNYRVFTTNVSLRGAKSLLNDDNTSS